MAALFPVTLHDVRNLARVRDDLNLQTLLFTAEQQDRWLDAEVCWARLQTEVGSEGAALEHPGAAMGATARLLSDALHRIYSDQRAALR